MRTYRTLGIIIPAFNESKNLVILISRIANLYPQVHVVIVDDSDLQERGQIQKLVTKKYPMVDIHLIYRGKKEGRGSAVLVGMKYLVANEHILYTVEMDADLAHKPEEISLLLDQKDKADIVIGSRYLTKSHIVKWPKRRLIQSKLINFFLQFWLGLHLSDYTNGFRLYGRRALVLLTRTQLREKGFISLSEMAYVAKKRGFTIAEVPITFTDRKFGQSNAGVRELLSSLLGAIRIRFRQY